MARDTDDSSKIPEDSNSKPMDSKRDVEQSNDPKIDQDFPGYPHYPAKDDIMDKRNGTEKVSADVENLPSNRNSADANRRSLAGQDRRDVENAMNPQPGLGDDDLDIHMGTEADVNDDDLIALNSTDAEIGTPQNVSNEDINSDLDVPGSDLDDNDEETGEEDEENNYYSLGGDRHTSQEEDPQSGPVREGF